jgi:hypothetical protein
MSGWPPPTGPGGAGASPRRLYPPRMDAAAEKHPVWKSCGAAKNIILKELINWSRGRISNYQASY